MGNFAVVLDDDNIEHCLSITLANLRMYQEALIAGNENKSQYLLSFAQDALEKAVIAHKRKHSSPSSTQK